MIGTLFVALLIAAQIALAVLYLRRLFYGFRERKTEFASHVYDRSTKPGAYWGFMLFYAFCIFAAVLIGLLLMRFL